jgi:hypothetical protein
LAWVRPDAKRGEERLLDEREAPLPRRVTDEEDVAGAGADARLCSEGVDTFTSFKKRNLDMSKRKKEKLALD